MCLILFNLVYSDQMWDEHHVAHPSLCLSIYQSLYLQLLLILMLKYKSLSLFLWLMLDLTQCLNSARNSDNDNHHKLILPANLLPLFPCLLAYLLPFPFLLSSHIILFHFTSSWLSFHFSNVPYLFFNLSELFTSSFLLLPPLTNYTIALHTIALHWIELVSRRRHRDARRRNRRWNGNHHWHFWWW